MTQANTGAAADALTGPISAHPISAHQISARLRERLAPTQLHVIDESGQHAGHAHASAAGLGTHFRVRIAAPGFAPLSRVARHRLVYDALGDFMAQGVHAIAIEIL